MYRELLIHPGPLAGSQLYPKDARRLVSEAIGDAPVNRALFHHQPDGKTCQGRIGDDRKGKGFGQLPHVTFGGGEGLIRVVGLGREGSDLVSAAAPIIASGMLTRFGGACRIRTAEGRHDLTRSDLQLYQIHNLCIAKKTETIRRCADDTGAFTLASAEAAIRRAIIGGLVSQSDRLDRDGDRNRNDERFSAALPTDAALDLQLLEGRLVLQKFSDRAHALFVSRLVFSMGLWLQGPWYAGLLRSRGFGRIAQLRNRGDAL